MIAKAGLKFVIKSETTGQRLSKPLSKKAAVKRLQQIEYFKRLHKSRGAL